MQPERRSRCVLNQVTRQSQVDKSALGAVIGLLAGVVATGPMTVAMILWHRRLPISERYPLPPREITMKLARKAGVSDEMSYEARTAATLVAHFGYGGAAGAIYGAISDKVPAPPLCKGIGFGFLLWAGSYLGWLPGAGVLRGAADHPARRNLLMIGSHIVWGAALGVVTDILKEETKGAGAKSFSASLLPHRDL